MPIQRNLSSYENFDLSDQGQTTPEVTIKQNNYENVGRMDEIGIPVFDDNPRHDLSSPIMIRKLQNGDARMLSTSPIGSPYENVYYNRNNALGFKPKSPNTQSPRTRIKTTFAHKNLPSPQYFVFPTPPPSDNSKKPNFNQHHNEQKEHSNEHKNIINNENEQKPTSPNKQDKVGIEKQLSLEEEIPMIDDADLTNDLEFRYSKIEKPREENRRSFKDEVTETNVFIQKEIEIAPEKLTKNKSFDDVKKELMADIPELEEFEKDLQDSKREKMIKHITEDIKRMDIEADSIDSVLDDNADELKSRYDKLKEDRRKLVTEIHEIKCKMSEIRSQEDDILREVSNELLYFM